MLALGNIGLQTTGRDKSCDLAYCSIGPTASLLRAILGFGLTLSKFFNQAHDVGQCCGDTHSPIQSPYIHLPTSPRKFVTGASPDGGTTVTINNPTILVGTRCLSCL
jgi:hypothetical protein